MVVLFLRSVVLLGLILIPGMVFAQGQLPGTGSSGGIAVSTSLPLQKNFIAEALVSFDGAFLAGTDKKLLNLTAKAKVNALPFLDPETTSPCTFSLVCPSGFSDLFYEQSVSSQSFDLPSHLELGPTVVTLEKVVSIPGMGNSIYQVETVSIGYVEPVLRPATLVGVRAAIICGSTPEEDQVQFQISYTATNDSATRELSLPVSIKNSSGYWYTATFGTLGPKSSVFRTVEHTVSARSVLDTNGNVSVKMRGLTGPVTVKPYLFGN